MRKVIREHSQKENLTGNNKWLDLEALAQAEITSEDASFPVEGALTANNGSGWRASKPGVQTLRILFDEPQQINSIYLVFEEKKFARTQEFVLKYSAEQQQPEQEIVRQQFNFSPGSAIRETENYNVNLSGVKVLELIINPDINGGPVIASMLEMRLA